MREHTPGPWVATNIERPWMCGGDGGTVEAVTPDGRLVRREICTFLLDTGDGDEESPELREDIANARLIAASPRMYEYIKARAGEGDSDAQAIIASIDNG